MSWQLREGLFHCHCGSQALFLDSQSNRYFALPSELDPVFRKIVSNENLAIGDWQHVQSLVDSTVLVQAPPQASNSWPQPLPMPTCDLQSDAPGEFPIALIFKAICSRIWARRLVDRNGIGDLRRILEGVPVRHGIARQPHSKSGLAQLKSVFDLVDRLISARDECLPRSLALHRLAKGLGFNTVTVLGVRTEPFAAHCWVEFDRAVITGDFEQARLFTPIMTIA